MLLAAATLLLLFWRAAPRVASVFGALFAVTLFLSPKFAQLCRDALAVLLDDLEGRIQAPGPADFVFPASLLISGPQQQALMSLLVLLYRTNAARVAGGLETVVAGLRGAGKVAEKVLLKKTELQKRVAGLAEGALAELALFRDMHFGRRVENAEERAEGESEGRDGSDEEKPSEHAES